MIAAAASSTRRNTLDAVKEAVEAVQAGLGGARPDLAFFFATTQHAPKLEEAAAKLEETLGARNSLGCTAESVIGGDVEHEGKAAWTLWAASLPGAKIQTSQISLEETPDGHAFTGIPELPSGPATMLLLGEPYSFPADQFLQQMGEDHPELQLLGGMSSGAHGPGENRLFLGGETLVDGAVAAVLSGGARVRPLVSQGCRPFGKHHVVTRADRNLILELGGRPAVEKLREQIGEATPAERAMIDCGLHVGIAIDARKREHKRGDFLVRNVMGVHRDSGGIVVTDVVKPGATIQFHVRDAETASEDLQVLLGEARAAGSRPLGALLFSCNGRGTRLFDVPNHDAACVSRELGQVPLAGFFAAGEIGPIGCRNFLHGFTASMAIFEEGD